MADETTVTPDEAGNSTTTEAVPTEAPSENWEQRFKDTQAAFTRTNQTLADRDALMAHIAENFPELIEEEPDPDPEPAGAEDLTAAEVAELRQQVAALEQRVSPIESTFADSQFESDLKAITDGRELSPFARQTIERMTMDNGRDRNALEQAVKDWFEHEDSLVPEPRKRKATVPPGGTAPDGPDKKPEDMNDQELLAWQVSRLQAEQH